MLLLNAQSILLTGLNQWENKKKKKLPHNFELPKKLSILDIIIDNTMKKINWEKVVDVAVFIVATAVGITIFGFAFVFAKAILESVF